MADKDAEALAPGESSSGIRVWAAGFYSFPSGGWGCGLCVCTLLCTDPPAFTPQSLTGHLL